MDYEFLNDLQLSESSSSSSSSSSASEEEEELKTRASSPSLSSDDDFLPDGDAISDDSYSLHLTDDEMNEATACAPFPDEVFMLDDEASQPDHGFERKSNCAYRSIGIQVDERSGYLLKKQTDGTMCCTEGCDARQRKYLELLISCQKVAHVSESRLKRQLTDAHLKLDAAPSVKCPNCQLEFRPKPCKELQPGYIKYLRSSNTLEIQFDSIEACREWMFLHGVENDQHGIPYLIEIENAKVSMREVNCFAIEFAIELTKRMFHRRNSNKQPSESDVWMIPRSTGKNTNRELMPLSRIEIETAVECTLQRLKNESSTPCGSTLPNQVAEKPILPQQELRASASLKLSHSVDVNLKGNAPIPPPLRRSPRKRCATPSVPSQSMISPPKLKDPSNLTNTCLIPCEVNKRGIDPRLKRPKKFTQPCMRLPLMWINKQKPVQTTATPKIPEKILTEALEDGELASSRSCGFSVEQRKPSSHFRARLYDKHPTRMRSNSPPSKRERHNSRLRRETRQNSHSRRSNNREDHFSKNHAGSPHSRHASPTFRKRRGKYRKR